MDILQNRMEVCEKAMTETYDQIKTLQNRHQQLIGYKQALNDVQSDFDQESQMISVEDIAPKKKPNP